MLRRRNILAIVLTGILLLGVCAYINLEPEPATEVVLRPGWASKKPIHVAQSVTVTAEATNALKVQFFAKPLGDESLGLLIGGDSRGTTWRVPYAKSPMVLTALIHYQDRVEEAHAMVIWQGKQEQKIEVATNARQLNSSFGTIKQLTSVPQYFTSQGWIDNTNLFGTIDRFAVAIDVKSGQPKANVIKLTRRVKIKNESRLSKR